MIAGRSQITLIVRFHAIHFLVSVDVDYCHQIPHLLFVNCHQINHLLFVIC